MKEQPDPKYWLSGTNFSRSGMVKWCKPNSYLEHVSCHNSILLFKDLFWSPSLGTYGTWWLSFKQQSFDQLGWYIDLAIKIWNYRVK